MKLRYLLLSGLALGSLSLFAQTHKEGVEYYKADQFVNAQELLKRNLNNAGTDKATAYYYLGQIEMRAKNTSGATKYFNDGIQADPENPYNYIGLGYVALKNNDVKGAEKYFKDAEKRAKKDQSVMVDIARAYYEADPVAYKEKYEKIVANALKKDVKNPDIYIFEGDVLRDDAYATEDSKTYGKAAAKYDMATSYDPQSAVAYVKYADMYMNAKNPGYAIVKLEELSKNNSASALGQRELANAYYENNQFDKAAAKYGEYVHNPNHFKEDEDRYALLLFYADNYKGGYDYATQLLKENPDNFTAQRFQFMNASYRDDMKDQLLPMAEALYRNHKANKANKFAPIDYSLIADAMSEGGQMAEAIEVLEEGIANEPDMGSLKRALSATYYQNQQFDKAADAYAAYINSTATPSYKELITATKYAFNAANKVADNAKYFDLATQFANKAAEVDPTQFIPNKLLGDIALTKATKEQAGTAAFADYLNAANKLDKLIAEGGNDYKQTLANDSDAKLVYKYLGAYYVENQDIPNAKKYLGQYLELYPDDSAIRSVYDSLK